MSTAPEPSDPVEALTVRLRAAGLTITRAGQVDQPFFSVRADLLVTGTSEIEVFVLASADAAATAAATVSRDATTVGTTKVSWAAPPHFYRSDRLLVLYVGTNASVLAALNQVLGPPFAGA